MSDRSSDGEARHPAATPETTLARVADVRSGYAFRKGVRDDPAGDVRVLQLGDLDADGRFDPEALARTVFGARAERHVIDPGDVLITSRGERAVAFRVPEDEPVVAASGMLIVSPRSTLDSDYLRWYLNHPRVRRRLDRLREGSNLRFLERSSLERLPIPVPPLPLQREIAGQHEEQRRRRELRMMLSELEEGIMDETNWQRAIRATAPDTDDDA